MSETTIRMTETAPVPEATPAQPPPEAAVDPDPIRARKFQRMLDLVSRVRMVPGKGRLFVRFNQVEIIEHWILLVNFLVLAATGLLEMFAYNRLVAGIITAVFTNIDQARNVHNLAGLFFSSMLLFHAFRVIANWFVKSQPPVLIPRGEDWREIGQLTRYLLSRRQPRPGSGRFTPEQKITYWATVLFSGGLFLTALVLWFQALVARVAPEAVVPMARSLHAQIGLLAVVSLLPWHLYHTLVKERNTSIFSGWMDEKAIRRKHPLDYRQMMEAMDEYHALMAAGEPRPGKDELDVDQRKDELPGNDQAGEIGPSIAPGVEVTPPEAEVSGKIEPLNGVADEDAGTHA